MKTKKKSALWLWQRDLDKGFCPCGKPASTVDHIIPIYLLKIFLRKEAVWDWEENFQFLCKTCNQIKAAQLDYRHPKTIILLKTCMEDLERQLLSINQNKDGKTT